MEVKNKVQYIDIDKLELLENNPRQINKENFNKLKKSIRDNKDYFEARPLIVSNRTGKNIIIAGNQRYKASKELNLKQVPCVILKDLTEDKEKEIIIRDNVELGDWDYDLLSSNYDVELLNDWGVDVLNEKDELDITKSIYTSKITSPVYEKQEEEKPNINDCVDIEKYNYFIETINKLNTNEEEKTFLKLLATRYIVLILEI